MPPQRRRSAHRRRLLTSQRPTDSVTTRPHLHRRQSSSAPPRIPAFQLDLGASPPRRRTLPEADSLRPGARPLPRPPRRRQATPRGPHRPAPPARPQPNDPLLYEKLAAFLDQNNLSAQQEETYKLAIAQFPGSPPGTTSSPASTSASSSARPSPTLTRQVTDIFSGTELDAYFAAACNSGRSPSARNSPCSSTSTPQKRFPHDLVFTRNLLAAYQAATHPRPRRLRSAPPPPLVGVRRPPRPVPRLTSAAPASSNARTSWVPYSIGCRTLDPGAQPDPRRLQSRRHPRARRNRNLHLPLRSWPPRSLGARRRPLPRRPRPSATTPSRSSARSPTSTPHPPRPDAPSPSKPTSSPPRPTTPTASPRSAISTPKPPAPAAKTSPAAAPYWQRIPTLHPGSTRGLPHLRHHLLGLLPVRRRARRARTPPAPASTSPRSSATRPEPSKRTATTSRPPSPSTPPPSSTRSTRA